MAETEEFYDVFELSSNANHFLSEILANFSKDVKLLNRKLQKYLQSSNFRILIDSVLLLISNFLKHAIIDLFELFKDFVEGRPLDRIIG
jgi:hypothetical protein